MRKFFAFIVIVALAIILVPWLNPARAEQVDVYQNDQLVKSVVFKIGVPYYVVNGQTPGVKMDVAPFIEKDRTFVPVRFLGNALGIADSNITWDGPTQTATLKGAKALSMTIGKAQVTSDGQTKAIDVAPMLVDPGRTMLPARFVAEGLGYQVDWDEATQTVVCWPVGQAKPDVSAAVNWLVQPGNTVNGYVIPANTELYIFDKPFQVAHDGKLITFQILLKKGNLQQQYADAESILLQRLDAATVNAAIDFTKVTQEALLSDEPWDIKTFYSSNGMAVRTGPGWGGTSLQFDVWQTE